MNKQIILVEHFIKNSRTSFDCRRLLRKVYGIKNVRKYLFNKQNKECAICGKKINFKDAFLDHCHQQNINRAILCNSCNVGLGFFMDNCEYLKKAIKYLKKYE